MLRDPHFAARDMLLRLRSMQGWDVPMAGVVPKFSRTPGSVRTAGPRLGEHTRAILREYGAIDEATFDQLEKRGLVVDGSH
jgi:crotonobetainyl-CoA:carnitine CoA-transferase CaiB-like acyl-CoA transferase